MFLNWEGKGCVQHLQKLQVMKAVREASLPQWGPSHDHTQSSTCSRDHRAQGTVETSTHSFCVTGTHAEANVLARQVQPVVILNTRCLGWDVSNSHRCESGVQHWGLSNRNPRDSPELPLSPGLCTGSSSVGHALPIPSSSKLLPILQDLPFRGLTQLPGCLEGPLLAPSAPGASFHQSICLCSLLLITPLDCEQETGMMPICAPVPNTGVDTEEI